MHIYIQRVHAQLENARSSGEWIRLVQYCTLIEDRRSSTDPVLTFECCV